MLLLLIVWLLLLLSLTLLLLLWGLLNLVGVSGLLSILQYCFNIRFAIFEKRFRLKIILGISTKLIENICYTPWIRRQSHVSLSKNRQQLFLNYFIVVFHELLHYKIKEEVSCRIWISHLINNLVQNAISHLVIGCFGQFIKQMVNRIFGLL